MEATKLAEVLDLHRKWLAGDSAGVRANLSGANLYGADLSRADLSRANLSGANLCGADLSGANGSNTVGIRLLTMHLTPYSLTYRSDSDRIHIGCQLLTAAEWLSERGADIAEQANLHPLQYKEYIIAIKAIQEMLKCG